MLLSTPEEVAPTLASFYALGAKRNGWLCHRSMAGRVASGSIHESGTSPSARTSSDAPDGRGFDPSTAPGVEDGHLGLTVMRERARGYGGECEITSSPDTGTLVTLWIPL